MKLKHLLSFFIVSGLITACGHSSHKFVIDGAIKGMPEQTVILEQLNANDIITVVDSQHSDKKGNFEISGEAPEPGLYRLHFADKKFILLSLDKGNLKVTGDWSNIESYSISGSEPSENLRKFIIGIREHLRDINTMLVVVDTLQHKGNDSLLQIGRKELADVQYNFTEFAEVYADTVRYQPNAVFAARMVNTDLNFIENFYPGLQRKFPGTKMTKDFGEYYARLDIKARKTKPEAGRIDVGAMAPDIVMNTPDGKQVALSSLKGKYVLVDFWASWNKGSRAENPAVVAAYNKFRDKNFEVYGVSLDNQGQKDNWIKAIAEDHLTWTQVSDLKGMNSDAARAYGVQSLPFNYLIDPTGKVIARDLRGDALINMLTGVLK